MHRSPAHPILLRVLLICTILFNISSIAYAYLLLLLSLGYGGDNHRVFKIFIGYLLFAIAMLLACGVAWWRGRKGWAIGLAAVPPVILFTFVLLDP
jgi:hypothetical protein